jgi:uncharacterized membrane protein
MASHTQRVADFSPRNVALHVRLPKSLSDALERAARREANPLSATVRRLISLGLEVEEQRSAAR